MIQRVQQIGSSNAASITLPFPSVEQIRRVADDPASEESVLQRLRASFCYLPRHEHAVLGEAARVASRCERAWVFSEPEVVQTKQLLGVARPQPSQSPDLSVRLADFHREYTTQLAESCVLQRRIAETLWYRNARTGQVTYVESVEDALRRSDRDSLLRAAIHLFLETFLHEQRRFAFGSSLKDLVHRALRQYPAELHQLLLTSTRGDFWSRYDRDLLAYAQSASDDARERLHALYFDGDEERFEREIGRMRALSTEAVAARQRSHCEQMMRLSSARVRKGYARLGDLPAHRALASSDVKADITHIDQLLWVDNVLEKYIDHKHLLHHEMFLRLHMVRLAAATVLADRNMDVAAMTAQTAADAMADLLGRSPREVCAEGPRGADLKQLTRWFGQEAAAFASPSTELAARMLALLSEQPKERKHGRMPRSVANERVGAVAVAA